MGFEQKHGIEAISRVFGARVAGIDLPFDGLALEPIGLPGDNRCPIAEFVVTAAWLPSCLGIVLAVIKIPAIAFRLFGNEVLG